MVAAFVKLRNRQNHKSPLTELVDSQSDIFEVRVGHKDIARAFFFFRKGQRIIITNGYVKRTQKLDAAQLRAARQYKQDWEVRFP